MLVSLRSDEEEDVTGKPILETKEAWDAPPGRPRRAIAFLRWHYAAAVSFFLVSGYYANLFDHGILLGSWVRMGPMDVLYFAGVLALPIVLVQLWRRSLGFPLFVALVALVFLLGSLHLGGSRFLSAQITALGFLLASYCVFREGAAFWVRRIVLVFLLFAVALTLFEVVSPGVLSKVPGRAAGFYVNPNKAGFALNAGFVLAVGAVPPRWRGILLLAVGAAVLGTLSRSAIIVWALMVFALWVQGGLHAPRRKALLASVGAALIFVPFFFWAYQAPSTSLVACKKMAAVAVRVVEGSTGSELGTDLCRGKVRNSMKNDDVRAELLGGVWSAYRESPLVGVGMERAWALRPHNSYLLYAAAYGLVGWLLVPALGFVVAAASHRRLALPVALVVLGTAFFNHNLLTDYTSLAVLALFGAGVARDEWKSGVPPT